LCCRQAVYYHFFSWGEVLGAIRHRQSPIASQEEGTARGEG
jgi:hypothetical protein